MKRISLLISGLFLTIVSYCQNPDTANVSLTLRAQDWAWLIGKYGAGSDSLSRVRIRNLRAAMLAANPATWTTNVTLTVNGRIVVWAYDTYSRAGFGEIINMGANNAERTVIYTNIRALNNAAIQYYIGLIDGNMSSEFLNTRQQGKQILLDN